MGVASRWLFAWLSASAWMCRAKPPAPYEPFTVHPWVPGARLEATDPGRVYLIANCSVADAFVRSLPSESSDEVAWEPWRSYMAAVYGEPAAHRVNVSDFNFFWGVCLSWPPRVPDELACSGFSLFSTYLAAHRASIPSLQLRRVGDRYVVPRGGMVEVFRSSHLLAPEGVGYGCWFYMARGTGMWVRTGRTFITARHNANLMWNNVLDEQSGTKRWVLKLAPRGAFVCVAQGRVTDELSVVGHVNPRAAMPTKSRHPPQLHLRLGMCDSASAHATQALVQGKTIYALPVADGTWPLRARQRHLDSLQIFPTTRRGHIELVLATPACMLRREPIGRCAPAGVVFTGLNPAAAGSALARECACHEPRRMNRSTEMMRCDQPPRR
jgi:hypothetical protein